MSEHDHETVEADMNTEGAAGCPVNAGRMGHPTESGSNTDWWPNQLNLKILRKHGEVASPMSADFDYKTAFESVDLDELAGLPHTDIVAIGLAAHDARHPRG